MSSTADRLHLLVYPFLASGHIISFLDLIKRLLDHGLVVTVLVTPLNLSRFPVPLVPPLPTHPQCPRHHCPRACGLGSGAAPHEQEYPPDSVELARILASSVNVNGHMPNRARVRELREAATMAVGPAGSSDKGLDALIKALTELKSEGHQAVTCLPEKGD
ncbi:hypothetical protein CDL15_Pgr008777 [Punica granatum]|uniref:Uncharacterized protein n=1 Tax=Punica granatum TaxID=22663 RepID=A0A218VYN9_PUNGR|nr:hypothetical protein CDL15_Pgr008777 [Punica granatum]